MSRKAVVTQIQVGVATQAARLQAAITAAYFAPEEFAARPKLIFVIKCNDGQTRQITIRDEDTETVAYGDFAGLPSFLEYAREAVGGIENGDGPGADVQISPSQPRPRHDTRPSRSLM